MPVTCEAGVAVDPVVMRTMGSAVQARPLAKLLAYIGREWRERGLNGLWLALLRLGGVLMHLPEHLRLVRVLSHPASRDVAAYFPRLAYRYTLPYLSMQFARDQRYDMLLAHYTALNQRFTPSFMPCVLAGAVHVWRANMDGHELTVSFKGPCLRTRHREGELTLVMQVDDVAVFEVSFAFVPAAAVSGSPSRPGGQAELVIYVGRVQGLPGQYERIRQATKLCGEVAPPDVLMAGLAGLARALGIHQILGVDNDSNISHETIRRSRTSFEYAEFWGRYNARFIEGGHAVMDLPFAEKPLTDIAARHRKRTLLKREFKKTLADQVQAAMGSYLLKR